VSLHLSGVKATRKFYSVNFLRALSDKQNKLMLIRVIKYNYFRCVTL